MVVKSCSWPLPVEVVAALGKLMVHVPVQGGTTYPRRVLTSCLWSRRETSAGVAGKEVVALSSLITTPIAGRMTVPRRVRSGSAKPEAKVERTETAAIRVSFMVDRR